ncbi:PAS-domain containing protein [Rhizobium sp. S95]|uniref:Sensory/regulatory protein RpfC n=1 Tax=Ciceribacter sichuanensis TaxID=2949647 RepID=A0AAJ1BVC5_9HYPH|nr:MULTISPECIES: PAS-domain containing protein [unclassified Ciceribacter]MCM2398768.1 PAS-domain containing protein [Ciceribacter sp. S95]MCO5957026.1 PAS-domain containing protein [Ciceribacter sp. S101]
MNTGGDLLRLACEKIAELDVPAFVKDSELRYVSVNEAYARFMRVSSQSIAGKTDQEAFGQAEYLDRDDRERRALVFGEDERALVLNPGGSQRVALKIERFLDEDDSIFLFGMAEGMPRRVIEERTPSASVPSTTDRTELLRMVLEDIPTATFVRDSDHRMVFANDAYAAIVNIDRDDLIGKDEWETFGDKGGTYHTENSQVLQGGKVLLTEQVFRFVDGFELPAITRKNRITASNGKHYLVGSITDTTATKQRERELIEARAEAEELHSYLESLLKSLPVGVMILDDALTIEYVNDAFCDMLEADDTYQPVGHSYRAFLDYNFSRGRYGDTALVDVEAIYQARLSQFSEDGNSVVSQAETPGGLILAIRSRRLANGKILVTYSDVTELHQREQETILYRTAIEQLPVPVFIRDSDRRLIFANAAYEMLQGKPRDEFYGMREDEMFPHSGKQLRAENEQVLATGESFERPQDIMLPGERPASVITRLNRIMTADDHRYIVGSITDVTLLKVRERELIEAQGRAEKLYDDLLSVFHIMPVGVAILNRDMIVEFVNEKCSTIWCWPKDVPLEGMSFRYYCELNRGRGWSWPDVEFEEGYRQRVELFRSLQGSVVRDLVYDDGKYVLSTVTRLNDDRILLTYSDLTDIRRRELEISEARAQLERLGQVMQDATRVMSQGLVVIEDGVIIESNDALVRILGLPPVMVEKGQSWHAAFAYCAKRGDFGPDAMSILREWREKARSASGVSTTFLANRKTWVQMEATVSGRGHWMVVMTDVTEIKKGEEELKVLLARSEAADKAKSEFLANMSHEIRTPMNGVLGMAELLSKSALDTRQKTFVDIIVKSGNALLTIINDILDFSRIDAGQLQLRKTPFDPVEAIEDVATLLSASASEKDIELIVRGDATVRHMVIGDAGRFRQVVTNLVGNAIKFTEKGHVLIAVSSEALAEGRTLLTVQIEDTGIGIPAEKRASIFEKFSQVDSSSTRRHEGTGLGLAITAGLVGLFGGHIDVESELGKGSVFTVQLPFVMASERQKHNAMPVNVRNAHVLVIDDNAVNRQILTEQLTMWGFDCLAVESGPAALSILEEAAQVGVVIDALIIDYQMPVMNGVDVARLIRADRRFDASAIIFLTSMDMLGDERIFQELNIQAHLMKPARANLLRSAVIDVVRAARLRTHAGRFMAPAPAPASARVSSPVLSAPPVQTAERKEERKAPVASACDVLIAEDNEVNQIVFRQIMQATNLTWRIVENGREAVDAWRSLSPRLILMDVSMPVLNGHQAARTIREEERALGDGQHVPIIGVTAHAQDLDQELCLAAGMDDYMSKPISPENMQQKINQWLSSQSSRGALEAGE